MFGIFNEHSEEQRSRGLLEAFDTQETTQLAKVTTSSRIDVESSFTFRNGSFPFSARL